MNKSIKKPKAKAPKSNILIINKNLKTNTKKSQKTVTKIS